MADIHWAAAVNGRFDRASDWIGGVVPTVSDDAILDAPGGRFIVASDHGQTVAGIQLAANAVLQLDHGVFTAVDGTDGGVNAGLISVGDGASLAVGGLVDNAGVISLNSYGDATRLMILSDTTLTGDGQVMLSGDPSNAILAASGQRATLVNLDDTIAGAGVIDTHHGGGRLKLINRAFGVIASVASQQTLKLTASTGTGSLINAGLIEAVNGGFVDISNMMVTGPGGTIFAGRSSYISIATSTVEGQALKTAPGGALYLSGDTIGIAGVVSNGGSITLEKDAEFLLSGRVSLTGGGYFNLAGQLIANAPATLISDNTIQTSGDIGDANLGWVNQEHGVIETFTYVNGLTIEMGANTFVNAGVIGGNSGGITIKGAVDNSGLIGAANGGVSVAGPVTNSGTLNFMTADSSVDNSGVVEWATIKGALVNTGTIYEPYGSFAQVAGAVSGDGGVTIDGGAVSFGSSFSENVQFGSKGGGLSLAQSQGYTGQVSGFTTDGGSRFYLGDIAFVGSGEATYSGTTSSGVLTVTDGTHTARMAMIGDYTTATFTASAGGSNSTIISASAHKGAAESLAGSAATFTAAMASLQTAGASLIHEWGAASARLSILAAPRA